MSLAEALTVLAYSCEQHGQPLQAIHAVAALCAQPLLPEAETRARLHLARLLLAHTSHLQEAKKHLQRAHTLCKDLLGNHCLKAEVTAARGRMFHALKEAKQQAREYARGITDCAAGSNTSERYLLCRWSCYFHQRMAEVLVLQGQVDEARTVLQDGKILAVEESLVDQQILFQLFTFQLSIVSGNVKSVEEDMGVLSSSITSLDDVAAVEQAGLQPAFATYVTLQYSLLQALHHLRLGRYASLNKAVSTTSYELLAVQGMLDMLQQVQEQPLPYTWVSPPALSAIIHLISATLQRCAGRIKPAQQHVADGLSVLEAALALQGLDECSEEHQLCSMDSSRSLLALQLQLVVCRTQMQQTQGSLVDAQDSLMWCINLVSRYPTVLATAIPSVHILIGQYANNMCNYTTAAQHFQAAKANSADPLLQSDASALQAIALLAAGGAAAVEAAKDALGAIYHTDCAATGLGNQEVALSLLAIGLIKRQLGDTDGCKTRLTKALKIAHNKLCTHQMVCAVLNQLAPLQLAAGDTHGTRQMITSSITLAKGLGDVRMDCSAKQIMASLHTSMDEPQKAADALASAQRKAAELAAVREAAANNCERHVAILAWNL